VRWLLPEPLRPARRLGSRSMSSRVGLVLLVAVLAASVSDMSGLASTQATFTASGASDASFSTRAACSSPSAFPAAVVALGPTFYYRFAEAAGAVTVADASGNGNTGLVRNSSPTAGVAPPLVLGAVGAGLIWCDTTSGLTSAATSGALSSGSFVVWSTARPNPTTFTVMAFVRTVGTLGGRLIGMGSSTWAKDVHYERQLVVDDTGHIRFELYPGFRFQLTSPGTVNDGKPHFVVGTLGPAGACLYVDGQLAAADPAQTTAETYTANEQRNPPPPAGGSGGATPNGFGYWRVGWDNINGWGATDYAIAGVIDEAALFEGKQLSAAQVGALWRANHW